MNRTAVLFWVLMLMLPIKQLWAQINMDRLEALEKRDTTRKKKESGLEVNQFLGGRKPAHVIGVALGGGLPGGDWAKYYGGYGQVTVGYTYIFPNRVSIGVEGAILFGSKLKYDPISSLRDTSDHIIGYDGNNAELTYALQAFRSPVVSVGKYFVLRQREKRHQPEHALHLALKGGATVYKTRITDPTKTVPLLDKTNRKGFDNLRAGALFGVALSYWYVAPTGRYAFYLTAEPYLAFTQSQRSYNYNLGKKDIGTFSDQGVNLQLGFSLLLFQLGQEQEYFYQ